MSKLQQTKSSFRIRGVIQGKDNPTRRNGYREGVVKNGASAGKPYRSIRFLVQTAPDNKIPVEMFGMVRDTANWYNRQLQDNKKVPWEQRYNEPPAGYELIKPEFDQIQEINENFKDGDSVVVVGEIRFSTYEGQDGNIRQQKTYSIKNIYESTEDVDFENENFIEDNEFGLDIIVNDVMKVPQDEKTVISFYTVDYRGDFYPGQGEILHSNVSNGFLRNISRMKFGDFMRVNGIIHNRVIEEEIEIDDDWGTQESTAQQFYNALEITGVDPTTIMKKMYSQEDFAPTANQVFTGQNQDVTANIAQAFNGNDKSKESSNQLPWEN